MMPYAVVVLPLIHSLEDSGEWVQNWYAHVLRSCLLLGSGLTDYQLVLLRRDAFLSLSKLFYVVALSSDLEIQRANDLFHDLAVCVVTDLWFLKGFGGDWSSAADFVSNKVELMCNCIQHVSDVAVDEPQTLFAALTLCYAPNNHQLIQVSSILLTTNVR